LVLFSGTQTIGQATEECQFTDIISYHTETGLSKNQINYCLYIATERGHYKIVEFLVQQGADVNARPEEPTKTFSLSKKPRNDKTCLYIAAEKGFYHLVRLLLENGAEINAKSEYQTPLYIAYKKDHLEIFHYLILKGADIQAKDDNNQTVLMIARNRENRVQEKVYHLLEYYHKGELHINLNNYTDLHFAAEHGHLQNLLLLTEKGANVNAKDKDKRTPLHLATKEGHLDIVQYLIERRADENAKDRLGRTALHLSARNGHLQIVQCLIEKGADVIAEDKSGLTALHLSSENGHLQIVQYLIEKGAEVNAQDNEGQTALNLALDPDIFSSKYADVSNAKAGKLLLASRKEIAKYLTSISK
jgi:ankyrin repeat protein